jgi:hypothetical protein
MKLDETLFPSSDETQCYKLGIPKNWDSLKKILEPVTNPDFSVTSLKQRLFVDRVRGLFDATVNSSGQNALRHVISSFAYDYQQQGGEEEVLKMVLSAGLNPDLADKDDWRPSHICGSHGLIHSVNVLFPCRVDMTAKNSNSKTPLEAAQVPKYRVCICSLPCSGSENRK